MAALTVLAATVLNHWPQIDLAVSGWFYAAGGDAFFSPDLWWLAIPYRGMPLLGQALVVVVALLWLATFARRAPAALRARRGVLCFLLAGAVLGPVLVVDQGLKEYSGRARPFNVEQFGGSQQFTPVLVPSQACRKNCSFVSGHVAAASFFIAFGWLGSARTRRRWLLGGTAFAVFMGLARMAQGGHFLSDVVLAYFTVYWVLWGDEWLLRRFGGLPSQGAA
jgi:lipid A 4'-phosphatase